MPELTAKTLSEILVIQPKTSAKTIEIPVDDFYEMLEALKCVCDEWAGVESVEKFSRPVYEKYTHMQREI